MEEHISANKENQKPIIIPTQKKKIFFYFLISLGFVVGGVNMFFSKPARGRSELELKLVGSVCVLFFGVGVVIFLLQFFKKGLIISEKGVVEDISFFPIGLIRWEDIEKINIDKQKESSFMYIIIRKEAIPLYMGRIKNKFHQKLIGKDLKKGIYAIPIDFLDIKPEDLRAILHQILK